MRHWSSTFALVLAVLTMGCIKEPTVEPLPLSDLTIYDAVPVRSVPIPTSGGVALLCKRSIDDPVLAYALLFDQSGKLSSRLDFGQLPSVVENLSFQVDAWSITDLVPLADGTFLLIGIGRQVELEDRLHLLVYRVNGSGGLIAAPVRRYVADKSTLVRADDVDQLYRTKALGAIRANDRLVVCVRYDRSEGASTIAYNRSYQLSLNAEGSSYSSPPVQMAANSHLLRQVLPDGQGGTYTLLDTLNTTGPGTHLLVKRTTWGNQTIDGIEQGAITLRDAESTSVLVVDNEIVIAGNYQVEADARMPFFCRAASLSQLQAGTTLPDISGNDRSSVIAALVPQGNGFVAVTNVYEQRVLSIRALRDDRFCDLGTATFTAVGTVVENRTIIAGKGLRALGAWGPDASWVVGNFHPFRNTDYVHGFVAGITPP